MHPLCMSTVCFVEQALDYGVPESNVLGIRFGFRGFYDRDHKPVVLTRRWEASRQRQGAGLLGSVAA